LRISFARRFLLKLTRQTASSTDRLFDLLANRATLCGGLAASGEGKGKGGRKAVL
jgi:hypothetical protein